jgi:type I restriction enzyme S subunit
VKKLKFIADCFPSNVDKHSKSNEASVRLCNYTDVYKNEFITDDMSLMAATANDDQIDKFSLLKGDIIITKDSETANDIAVPAFVLENLSNVICGYHLAMIRPKDVINGKYLFRAFQSKRFNAQFEICSNGITRVGLGSSDLKKGLFLIPPLAEQKAIAEFLEKKTAMIDQAISIKEKQITLLKERRQILIHQAITRGLDPNVQLKDSGVEWIGMIPEGWEVKRLKYVLEERNERSLEGLEPLFMMSQKHGLVVRSEYHDKAEVAQSNEGNKIVRQNDLVFNKLKAHLGVFFKSEIPFHGLVSPDYAVYYSKGIIDDMKYLELLFRNPEYIGEFICRATGIVEGLIRLYTADLFDIAIPVPSLLEQHEILLHISNYSDKILKSITLKEQEIEKLKEYKATLINSAVTGKIKVD